MSSHAVNTGPIRLSAIAASLRYFLWTSAFFSRDDSPFRISAVPAIVIPCDAAGSRESIIKLTLGLDCKFRAFRLRDEVATKTRSPSNQNHTATMWIDPPGPSVARVATYRPSNNSRTDASAIEAIRIPQKFPHHEPLIRSRYLTSAQRASRLYRSAR